MILSVNLLTNPLSNNLPLDSTQPILPTSISHFQSSSYSSAKVEMSPRLMNSLHGTTNLILAVFQSAASTHITSQTTPRFPVTTLSASQSSLSLLCSKRCKVYIVVLSMFRLKYNTKIRVFLITVSLSDCLSYVGDVFKNL